MAILSAKQKKQIEAHAKSESDAVIAKKLRLDRQLVQAYLETRRQQRQRRERIFKVAVLMLPILLLLAVELILRMFNYAGDLSLFVADDSLPGFLRINENVGRRYFSAAEVTPETSKDIFRASKSARAYRIFVLGESTTAGYPYMYNGSMSKMLDQRLLDYFPDREIEVVNLAMPAINSFSLLDMIDEALAQRPDALIVYCGHNEFYGALGAASTESLGRWRAVIQLYLRLQKLKLMVLLRDGLEALKKMLAAAPPGGNGNNTLMEQMVAEENLPYEGAIYRRARRFYQANMEELVAAAQAQGVRVILANLVSNVRDLPPFVSIYSPGTNRSAYERMLFRGEQLAAQGEFSAASALYDTLQKIDPSPAALYFQIGKCQERMGNYAEAHRAYARARDLDGLRFRATADFNTALAEVARERGALLVDMEAAFARASPHGLVGKNLMLEHVHPSLEGYFIMGRELCRALRENGFVSPTWEETRSKPDSVYWQQRGVTALDDEVARIRIAVLTRNWPFAPKGQTATFNYLPRNLLEKLAYSTWKREDTWEKAHVFLAEDYEKRGELKLAAKEYEALILQTPYNVSPYVRAGQLYAQLNEDDRALDRLLRSLALEPTLPAYQLVGAILIRRRQPEQSIPYLEKALRLASDDAQTLFHLTAAYVLAGQDDHAMKTMPRLERLLPGSPQVEQLKREWARRRQAKQR